MRIRTGLCTGLLITLLAGCSGGPSDAELAASAQHYYEIGELRSAAIEARNALRLNGNNSDARLILGKLSLDTGDLLAAQKELTRAMETGASGDEAMPLLSQALLDSRQFDELLALEDGGLGNRARGRVLAAKGEALLLLGEVAKADSTISEATDLSDNDQYVMVARAHLLEYKQLRQQALAQLDATTSQYPDFAPAWELMGDIEFSARRLEAAELAYTTVIQSSPFNWEGYLKRALTRLELRNFSAAQEDIDVIKDKIPNHPALNYALGVIKFQDKEYQQAIDYFDKALSYIDHSSRGMLFLAMAHWFEGDIERSRSYALRYHNKYPENSLARKLLARIALVESNYEEAEEWISPVVDFGEQDLGAMNILTEALLRQGKVEESVAVLSEIESAGVESGQVELKLGVAKLGLGEGSAGFDHLRRAIDVNPDDYVAYAVLSQAYIAEGDYTSALEVAQLLYDRNPEDARSNSLLGRVYLVQGRDDAAKEYFLAARDIAPGDPVASQQLAFLAIKAENYDEARSYYTEVLDKAPDYLPVMRKLIALDKLEGKADDLVRHYQEAIAAHPAELDLRAGLGFYYLAEGELDKIEEVIIGLDSAQRSEPNILRLRAVTDLQKGDFGAARRILEQLSEIQPKSSAVHMLLAKAYGGLGDKAAMQVELEKALYIDANLTEARMALARLLVTENELSAVDRHMTILQEQAPDSASLAQLEGTVASMRGNQQLALDKYSVAFDRGPTRERMLIVARQKWIMGDIAGAGQVHESWLEENPGDVKARISLAVFYRDNVGQAEAIEEYQRVLQFDSGNVMALNSLAWQLRDSDPEQALKYAELASKLNSESATVQDTLAVVLLSNGEVGMARRAITRALDIAPDNPTLRYHAALIDIESGDKERAAQELGSLMDSALEFPEKAEAMALLRELNSAGIGVKSG